MAENNHGSDGNVQESASTAYAFIVRRTGSLWGPVIGHVIADMMFLLVTIAGSRVL